MSSTPVGSNGVGVEMYYADSYENLLATAIINKVSSFKLSRLDLFTPV